MGIRTQSEEPKVTARVFNNFIAKALQIKGPVGKFQQNKNELLFCLTGGDPMYDPDLMSILKLAREAGAKGNFPNLVITAETFTPRAAKTFLDAVDTTNKQRNELAVARSLLSDILPFQAMGIKGEITSTMVIWKGGTNAYKDLLKQNQFKWSDATWVAPITKGLSTRVKNIIEALRKDVDVAKHAAKELSLPQSFKALNIQVVALDNGYVQFIGNTRKYKDNLRSAGLNWDSTRWIGNLAKIDLRSIKNILDTFRADNEKAESPAPETTPEGKSPTIKKMRSGRPNRRGQHCYECGGWVEAGEGVLDRTLDEDDDKLIWIVLHKDPATCEEVKKQRRQQREEQKKRQQTKNEANKALRDYATKKGKNPDGWHTPKGRKIILDDKTIAYGGGYWVVIEPGEKDFWYVINNGADGDNWSYNNVQTGGAGAIGYRAPLTDSAKKWIETISGETI